MSFDEWWASVYRYGSDTYNAHTEKAFAECWEAARAAQRGADAAEAVAFAQELIADGNEITGNPSSVAFEVGRRIGRR